MGRRLGLSSVVLVGAVFALTGAPRTAADGSPLVVTISPGSSTAVAGSQSCVRIHVADSSGAPVVGAGPDVEFSKTPKGNFPDWQLPSTDTNGDTTLCLTFRDLGEYNLLVDRVATTSGGVSAASNTATIAVTTPPFNPGSLSATPLVSASRIVVGDDYHVVIVVNNESGRPAVGYRLLVQPPVGSFVSATPSRGSCTGVFVCDFGQIAAGETISVNVSLHATTGGVTIIPISWMTDPSANSVLFTRTTPALATVTPRNADLALTISPTRKETAFNHPFTAVLTVVNKGPDPVDDAALALSAPVAWLRVRPSAAAGCSASGSTCPLGHLATGGSRKITVTINPRRRGRVSLVATVSSPTATDLPLNNDARALVVTTRIR